LEEKERDQMKMVIQYNESRKALEIRASDKDRSMKTVIDGLSSNDARYIIGDIANYIVQEYQPADELEA